MTFTIDNTANVQAVGDLAFTDDLPLGLRVAPMPNTAVTCTGGAFLATAKASSISYSGGTVDAGSSCTLSVDVFGARAGSYLNTSSALTSAAEASAMATATLVVHQRPSFAKSFLPDPILPGETSTLTFTVDNSAGGAAVTGLAFTDQLPAGLVVATPNGAIDGCVGSLGAVAGSTSISYTGGTAAAGTICTVTVDVLGPSAGNHMNQSSALSSSAGFGSGNGPPSFEWAVGMDSTGSAFGHSVAVDSSDNVVNVGWFSGTADFDPGPGTANRTAGSSDPYATKLDENGDFVWAASVTNNGGRSEGVVVDGAGNVLVSGFVLGEADFDPGAGTFLLDGGSIVNTAFVWKLDSAGNLAWVAGLDEPLDGDDTAAGIAVDADDNVYVTGWFSSISDFDPGPGTLNLSSGGVNAFIWKLDPGGNLVWARITSGCAEDPSGVPACTLGTVAAGTSMPYTVTVTVDPSTRGVISNAASVSSSTAEGSPGDESTTEPTTVEAGADLSITKTDSADPVTAGDSLTYTVTVSNAGPADAEDVVVTDTLPAGVTLVSTSGCAEDPSGVPACTLGTVAVGSPEQFTVSVTVDPSTHGVITNAAGVSSSTLEAAPGDESTQQVTTVAGAAPSPCGPGEDNVVPNCNFTTGIGGWSASDSGLARSSVTFSWDDLEGSSRLATLYLCHPRSHLQRRRRLPGSGPVTGGDPVVLYRVNNEPSILAGPQVLGTLR